MDQHAEAARLILDIVLLEEDIAENNLIVANALINRRRRRDAAKRRWWTRKWLIRRPLYGQFEKLMSELVSEDPTSFKNFVRVPPEMFRELIIRVGAKIEKQDTVMRKALCPELKLAITLRHLATGDSYKSLMYSFRVAHNTISVFVRDVCEAIISEYEDEVLNCPTSADEWKKVSELFGSRWNFHHCIGALDGKHIAIKCPPGGGSLYFNYKKYHSIVLLALVDADYKFLWVDVGTPGSSSDPQLWNHCELKEAVDDGTIGIPNADPLPGDDKPMPYFIVADDAFAMRTTLMKPFSKRNMDRSERLFNYRLSRARRVVENAFGILANRFGCLLTTLRQEPETATKLTLASICLHNLMRIRYPAEQNALLDREDSEHNMTPGSWRNDVVMDDMARPIRGNFASKSAKEQQLYLKHYYNSPIGAVPWQDQMV